MDKDLLVIIVFYKLLELFNVSHRLQVLLHMWQGSEVICNSRNKTQRLDCPSPGADSWDLEAGSLSLGPGPKVGSGLNSALVVSDFGIWLGLGGR